MEQCGRPIDANGTNKLHRKLDEDIGADSQEKIKAVLDQVNRLSDKEKLLLYFKLPTGERPWRPKTPTASHACASKLSRSQRVQVEAQQWLRANYEPAGDGASVEKVELHAHYMRSCGSHVTSRLLNQPEFGKVVKHVFPAVNHRRLGNRSNSKFHYVGVRRRNQFRPPALSSLDALPCGVSSAASPSLKEACLEKTMKNVLLSYVNDRLKTRTFSDLISAVRWLVSGHYVAVDPVDAKTLGCHTFTPIAKDSSLSAGSSEKKQVELFDSKTSSKSKEPRPLLSSRKDDSLVLPHLPMTESSLPIAEMSDSGTCFQQKLQEIVRDRYCGCYLGDDNGGDHAPQRQDVCPIDLSFSQCDFSKTTCAQSLPGKSRNAYFQPIQPSPPCPSLASVALSPIDRLTQFSEKFLPPFPPGIPVMSTTRKRRASSSGTIKINMASSAVAGAARTLTTPELSRPTTASLTLPIAKLARKQGDVLRSPPSYSEAIANRMGRSCSVDSVTTNSHSRPHSRLSYQSPLLHPSFSEDSLDGETSNNLNNAALPSLFSSGVPRGAPPSKEECLDPACFSPHAFKQVGCPAGAVTSDSGTAVSESFGGMRLFSILGSMLENESGIEVSSSGRMAAGSHNELPPASWETEWSMNQPVCNETIL